MAVQFFSQCNKPYSEAKVSISHTTDTQWAKKGPIFFGLISCSNSGYFILLGTFYSKNSLIVKWHCWVAMMANYLLWYEISNNKYKTLQFPRTHMRKRINQQNTLQTQSLL